MTHQTPFEYDDLTVIKGIGPARQQWLREMFGVVSYADLAVLSAEAIHERLKEGQIASPAVIESWIRQAQALAAAPRSRPTPAIDQGWKPFAAFVVEYQEHEGGKRWYTTWRLTGLSTGPMCSRKPSAAG